MRTRLSLQQYTHPLLRWPIFQCCLATVFISRPVAHSLLLPSLCHSIRPSIHQIFPCRINHRSLTNIMAPSMKKKTTSEATDTSQSATPSPTETKRKRSSKTAADTSTELDTKPAKRSTRNTSASTTEVAVSEASVPASSEHKPAKRNARKSTTAQDKGAVDSADSMIVETVTEAVAEETDAVAVAAAAISTSPRKTKKVAHQVLTERDVLPKLWNDATAQAKGSFTFKIASWNVAGLRGLLKNHPDALANLVKQHDLDVLCLQETKLQELHLTDPKLKLQGHLLEEEGYDAYYSCSTEKKGYAGTAVFIKRRANNSKKQKTLDAFLGAHKTSKAKNDVPSDVAKLLTPVAVTYEMGITKHDTEGRLIVVDFPLFSLCNVYVPNSGQDLKRLEYRVGEWDTDFLAFMEQRQKDRGVPVLWLGDLNVAHTHLEVWNDGAKHLLKQAGVTPEERASFQKMLDSGWIDAFRKLHPTAKGHYSYWSQRAGNREPNKGLRLDYFICHPTFFDESSKVIARDSYMVSDCVGSDHCPVVLELEVKA